MVGDLIAAALPGGLCLLGAWYRNHERRFIDMNSAIALSYHPAFRLAAGSSSNVLIYNNGLGFAHMTCIDREL
jgi:hypothetical protein